VIAKEWAKNSALDHDKLIRDLIEWRSDGTVAPACQQLCKRAEDLLDKFQSDSPQRAMLEKLLRSDRLFFFKKTVTMLSSDIAPCCSLTSIPLEDCTAAFTIYSPSNEQVGYYVHQDFLTTLYALHAALNCTSLVKPSMLARYLTHAHETVSGAIKLPPFGK
jgi:hypothetical protein